MKALEPYLEGFGDISQKNFTFQPVTLQFKDPLHRYQSTRKAPTPYQPPRCPQWLHEVNFRTSDTPYSQQTREGKPRLQRLMDVKVDIATLPKGYLWQIDQRRQQMIKNEKQEPERGENEKREESQNHPQRKDSQRPENTVLPRRPMMGIYRVTNYKDKPPDEHNLHEWP